MAFTKPTHNPATGVTAPATWGDNLNDNFNALDTGFHVELFPQSSGEAPISGLNAAAYSVVQSSDGGTFKPQYPILSFDASTDEGRMWNRSAPRILGGTVQLSGAYYMGTANAAGTVILAAQFAAVSSGDGTVTAKAFGTIAYGTLTVPTAASVEAAFSFNVNTDSMAAIDRFTVVFSRDADNAGDNAAGDFHLTRLAFSHNLEA